MTGYGRAGDEDENLTITVEISSVNRKGLETGISLPREWQGMERELSEQVRAAVSRGKINIAVQVQNKAHAGGLNWDDTAVKQACARLKDLAKELGGNFEPTPDVLVRLITAMGTQGSLPDAEESLPQVKRVLAQALDAFVAMRRTEGSALEQDLSKRLELLSGWANEIRSLGADVVPRYRELLLERLQKAGLELNLDDERVLKEVALFADRCDVTEELTRLESHFAQFIETMAEAGPVGRKLDFLCQELHRETNTVGSKSNSVPITRLVIEMKNELERIREQVQNIE